MIGIQSTSAPSAWVHYEQVSPVVEKLLKESSALRRKFEWIQAARCALDAQEFCQETGAHVGLAVAQIHMVDFYCEVGELGQAIAVCEAAYQTLHSQPGRVHRHNEAVAAYALGLLHQLRLFGGHIQALHWYQEALQLFKTAQEYWAMCNAKSQIQVCRRAGRQIAKYRDDMITDSHAAQQPSRGAFTIWQLDSAKTPFTRAKNIRGYIIGDDRVTIGGTDYRLQSGKLPESDADQMHYHFALPVREDRWAVPETQTGDYVFVRQQWQVNKEKIGVMWEPGKGWTAGGFKREEDGQFRFYPLPPKVIEGARSTSNDPGGKVKGYITALLKPEK
jgi:hypothetical protein